MEKILIISKEVYSDYYNFDSNNRFKCFIRDMLSQKNKILFTSRDYSEVKKIEMYFSKLGYNKDNGIYAKTRDEVKQLVKSNNGSNFIIIGNRDKDLS